MYINQLTPQILLHNKTNIYQFLSSQFTPLINHQSWMKDWEQIASRFSLLKFVQMNEQEATAYQWDEERVKRIIGEAVSEVRKHIPLEDVTITVMPAMPFPWFKKLDRSMWVNGFTNSPLDVQIAMPPNPDEQFLKYLIAHELHHASPINPIYQLKLEAFTLADWYKMEGTAEFFSLQLYEDKRWWKDDFDSETEAVYWEQAKNEIETTDEKVKGKLCFGDKSNGIPFMAGYACAYEIVKSYVKQHPVKEITDLYKIKVIDMIQVYNKTAQGR